MWSSSQVPVADVLGIAQGHECDAVGCEIYEHITYLYGAVVTVGNGLQ